MKNCFRFSFNLFLNVLLSYPNIFCFLILNLLINFSTLRFLLYTFGVCFLNLREKMGCCLNSFLSSLWKYYSGRCWYFVIFGQFLGQYFLKIQYVWKNKSKRGNISLLGYLCWFYFRAGLILISNLSPTLYFWHVHQILLPIACHFQHWLLYEVLVYCHKE